MCLTPDTAQGEPPLALDFVRTEFPDAYKFVQRCITPIGTDKDGAPVRPTAAVLLQDPFVADKSESVMRRDKQRWTPKRKKQLTHIPSTAAHDDIIIHGAWLLQDGSLGREGKASRWTQTGGRHQGHCWTVKGLALVVVAVVALGAVQVPALELKHQQQQQRQQVQVRRRPPPPQNQSQHRHVRRWHLHHPRQREVQLELQFLPLQLSLPLPLALSLLLLLVWRQCHQSQHQWHQYHQLLLCQHPPQQHQLKRPCQSLVVMSAHAASPWARHKKPQRQPSY